MMEVKKIKKFNHDSKSNTLIEISHTMNKNETSAFKRIVSMIEYNQKKLQVKISKKELFNLLYPDFKNKNDINLKILNRGLEKYCKEITKTTVNLHIPGEDGALIVYAVITAMIWPGEVEDYIIFKFSSLLAPFLNEIQGHIIDYPAEIAVKLKYKNSIRLYEYCRIVIHNQKQKEEYRWIVPLIELKRFMHLEYVCKNFDNFNEKVLLKSISTINDKTNLKIKCDPIMNPISHAMELFFTVNNYDTATQ